MYVEQFAAIGRLGKPADFAIAEAVEKIARVVERWDSRRLKVETITTAERREEDRQMAEEFQRVAGRSAPAHDDSPEHGNRANSKTSVPRLGT